MRRTCQRGRWYCPSNEDFMNYVDLVALLAVAQLVFFSVLVGRARGRYGVKAPAVTGHELFERAYRVQMNTLELLVAFLPALFIAARYWPQEYVAIIGAVYLLGRLVYWRSYTRAPASRGLGFILSILPVLALLLAALVGVVRTGLG
jgi:glutathione S-transferase